MPAHRPWQAPGHRRRRHCPRAQRLRLGNRPGRGPDRDNATAADEALKAKGGYLSRVSGHAAVLRWIRGTGWGADDRSGARLEGARPAAGGTRPRAQATADRQRHGLLPNHIPPPPSPTPDSTPAHHSGSGPQVRGTLHLMLERLLANTRPQSKAAPRRTGGHAARSAHQRMINRRERARSQACAPAHRFHQPARTATGQKSSPRSLNTDIRA